MMYAKTTIVLAAGLLAFGAGQALAQVALFSNDTRVPIEMEFGGSLYTVKAGDSVEIKITGDPLLKATPAGKASYSEKLDFRSVPPTVDPSDNAAVWCVTLSDTGAWVSTYNVCNDWLNNY